MKEGQQADRNHWLATEYEAISNTVKDTVTPSGVAMGAAHAIYNGESSCL